MANRSNQSDLDPRIERTRNLVLNATLQELAAVGYGASTIDSIASRAGVARSTIYRNWSDKVTLIQEALEILNVQPHARPEANHLSAREKVEGLLIHLTRAMSDSIFSDCLAALVGAADNHPEVAQFLHTYTNTRRQTLVNVLAEGISTNEFASDLDPETAALALSAPIIYCRLMTDKPFALNQTHKLLQTVLPMK